MSAHSCLRCLVRRRTKSAWPILVSLGNHSNAARNSQWGKACIGLIEPPAKDPEQSYENYSLCVSNYYQLLFKKILGLVNNWRGGFWLQLPGDDFLTLVVPRIGIFLADLVEARLLGGVQQNFSVRCETKVMFGRVGAAAACPEAFPGMTPRGDILLKLDEALARAPSYADVRIVCACGLRVHL